MTNAAAPAIPLTAKSSARQIARLITAAISLVFAGHLMFFAFGLDMTPLEVAYVADSGLYGTLVNALQMLVSVEFLIARYLSVVCAIISIILMANVCEGWCGDSIVGACLPAGLLLFPVSAYIFALSIPFALMLLLSLLSLRFATATGKVSLLRNAVIPAGLSGIVIFLDWSGIGLAVAIALAVMVTHRTLSISFAYTAALVVAVVLLSIFYPLPTEPNVLPPSVEVLTATSVDGLLMPYAMLWVGLAFSLAALGLSRSLRQRMGNSLLHRSALAILVFGVALIWLTASYPTSAGYMIALNAVIGLGVLACIPMVLWIRWVMPSIKSVWVWILLPVVMYSCFWVILGPIDWAGFPYDQLSP